MNSAPLFLVHAVVIHVCRMPGPPYSTRCSYVSLYYLFGNLSGLDSQRHNIQSYRYLRSRSRSPLRAGPSRLTDLLMNSARVRTIRSAIQPTERLCGIYWRYVDGIARSMQSAVVKAGRCWAAQTRRGGAGRSLSERRRAGKEIGRGGALRHSLQGCPSRVLRPVVFSR